VVVRIDGRERGVAAAIATESNEARWQGYFAGVSMLFRLLRVRTGSSVLTAIGA
jgi:hypothetical protein